MKRYVNATQQPGSDWREVATKQVLDSDGFLTDYTMYTDGKTYIFMFGDKDLYEPDRDYADWEAETEDRAWEWFNSYTGFADEDDDDYSIYGSERAAYEFDDANQSTLKLILEHDDTFKYHLLGRMQTDCNYFLGAGNGAEKFLWADNVPEQIAYMRAIYNSFPDDKKPDWISLADIDEYEEQMLRMSESLNAADELNLPKQEFDSAKTSINSNKLPAIYKMISIPNGSVGLDFGGGSFDNAIEFIKDLGATLYVYDPYNRSAEYNKQTIKALRDIGGADWAVNSNVLNVIKEPEARRAVLENISKITKPGAPIYITVYEGRGDSKEGPTKSGYQLNRKTQDYLQDIQEVFPDATRKGKLITAHNNTSSGSTADARYSSIEAEEDIYDLDKDSVIKAIMHKLGINKDAAAIIYNWYDAEDAFEDFDSVSDLVNYVKDDIYDMLDACTDDAERNIVEKALEQSNRSVNGRNLLHDPNIYDESGHVVNTSEDIYSEPAEVTDFKNAVNSADTIDDIQFLIYELSDGVAEEACQFAFDTALNSEVDDIDTIKHEVISAIDMYLEDNEFIEASQKLDASTDKKLTELKDEILSAVKDVMMSPNFGFLEDEVPEYSVVEVHPEGRVEVRAEVDYDGLMELASALNPIIQKYDKDSYFEPVEPGILEAYLDI